MLEGNTYEDTVDFLRIQIQKHFRQMVRNHYKEDAEMNVLKDFCNNDAEVPEEWIKKIENDWDEIFDDACQKMVSNKEQT